MFDNQLGHTQVYEISETELEQGFRILEGTALSYSQEFSKEDMEELEEQIYEMVDERANISDTDLSEDAREEMANLAAAHMAQFSYQNPNGTEWER